jgi:hypothetical protein
MKEFHSLAALPRAFPTPERLSTRSHSSRETDMGVACSTFRVAPVLHCREALHVSATITAHGSRPSVAEGVNADKTTADRVGGFQPVGRCFNARASWPNSNKPQPLVAAESYWALRARDNNPLQSLARGWLSGQDGRRGVESPKVPARPGGSSTRGSFQGS